LPFGKIGGFFVDSCILLPQPTESLRHSCREFILQHSSDCLISSSVKNEGLDLLERSHSIVVRNIKETLKPFLENQGIKEVTNRDGRLFAEFFSQRRHDIKRRHRTKSNVPNEILTTIEGYVASRLDSLQKGLKITPDDFLAALIRELSKIKHKLRLPFVTIHHVEIDPDNSLKILMIGKGKVCNINDAEHLVSSVTYQFQKNEWVIFVTNDDDHILPNQPELSHIFALQCSKPEWVIDYRRDMTRKKTPIEYYREIGTYSEDQITFGKNIEKLLATNILS